MSAFDPRTLPPPPRPAPPATAAAANPVQVVAEAQAILSEVAKLLAQLPATRTQAVRSCEIERERVVARQLAEMPLEALKSASEGRLRFGAVEANGFTTVASIRATTHYRLEAIQGVGPTTSMQLLAAAEQVEAALRVATRVRFDVDARPREQTALLAALRSLERAKRHIEPLAPRLESLTAAIAADLDTAQLETQRVKRFFAGRQRKTAAAEALNRLASVLANPHTSALGAEAGAAQQHLDVPHDPTDVWADYLERSVAYNGLLIEIGGLGPEAEAAHGFLPAEIVDRIKAMKLDTTLLNVSLRGYQAFGAKFALVQRRTILGDEMGLGKTIEALAVFCHLRAHGSNHFLVVCPASVMANWEHEIARHSQMEHTWRLHGSGRDHTLKQWEQHGGVGITMFDTLRVLRLPDLMLSAVVVDEAHYVKNPEAKRTKAVRSWLARADHTLLMSGTPMENRVEEFRNLVAHVRPALAAGIDTTAGVAGADAFRRTVAPVYLRRNQIDVLDELPPKIETADWLDLEGPALDVYRDAVADRNFMMMRRAAFLTDDPAHSPKLKRLLEIAEEAADNGRKVVVFSYFRDVIARVHAALGPLAMGPLTGSVSATDRQRLVDQFSARKDPAVLVSQIEAGGVGLNIQAASVVVLTEPQWKPSTEEQAVARCHRMGQVRPVEVHRLLTEDSVMSGCW